MCGDLEGFTNRENGACDRRNIKRTSYARCSKTSPFLLHAQDQAAAPIGQKLAHVNVRFESRPYCLEISAQQDATTSGRVILFCVAS